MNDLIQALLILQKYITEDDDAWNWPTQCEHDELIVNVSPDNVSEEDINRLHALGFISDDGPYGTFTSFKFGSC